MKDALLGSGVVGLWIPLSTLVKKEIRRFVRIWVQTLIPPAITISLYFLIFGRFIGAQVATIHGYSYMQFIVPGLIMMAIITNSYMNVCSSFFSSKFQKSVEEMLIAPMPESMIVLGYCLGGLARGLAVGFIVFVVSLGFSALTVYSPFFLVLFALLTATLFALGGLTNAIYAQKFDDISIVPTFVITPLTYLGGVFYSVENLPPIWRAFSKLNPVLYMVNGFRYGFLGVSDVSVSLTVVLLVACIVGLFCFNLVLLRRGTGLRA